MALKLPSMPPTKVDSAFKLKAPQEPMDLRSKIAEQVQATTGKAAPTTAPRGFESMEPLQKQKEELQKAMQPAQQQQAALGLQEQIQQQQFTTQQLAQTEKTLNLKQQMAQQTEELLGMFEKNKQALNMQRYQAALEQTGVMLRLQDSSYVSKLKTEGARARLMNQVRFKEELTKAILEDEAKLLENDLAFKRLMDQDARTFKEDLSNMNLEMAMKLAIADRDAANEAAKWTALGGLVTAGIDAYSAYKKQPSPSPAQPASTTTPFAGTINPYTAQTGVGINVTETD